MAEIIALAALDRLVRDKGSDPQTVQQRLMDVLAGRFPNEHAASGKTYADIKAYISDQGAAWAVAQVES